VRGTVCAHPQNIPEQCSGKVEKHFRFCYCHNDQPSSFFCLVLSCIVLFCSVLFCSVLFCSVLFCSVLFCSVLFCSVLSCRVVSCPVLSFLVLSCRVLYCLVLSCPVLSCPVLSYPVLSCPVLSCPVLSCPVLSCFVLFWLFFSDCCVLFLVFISLNYVTHDKIAIEESTNMINNNNIIDKNSNMITALMI
jgi:hypothetical protein